MTRYAPHVYFFFFFAAAASYSPFLAYWLKETGLTSQQVGAIYAIGPLVALFVQPMWGFLCDKYGIEKAVLMICGLATPAIAFGYSSGAGFAVYAATAVCLAVFSSPMVPLSDAVAVAHVQKHRQTYGGARVWGSIGFALVVSPIGMLYERIGISRMFLFYMGLMIVVFFITAVLEKGTVRKNASWRDIGKLLGRKPFALFLLLILCVACGTQSFSVFFSVYVGSTGGNVTEKIGWLTAVSALSELPFFLFASRFADKFGYRTVLAAGAFAGSIRLLVVSFDPPTGVLLASQLLQGVAYGLFYAAGVQVANALCPEGWKSTGQSLFSMVYVNVAILIASNAGGWLIDYAGFGTMFRVASLLCAIGGVGFLAMRKGGKSLGAEEAA
ncbi:MFS transporter [Paenibacillus flagellatus]|nr:MFS transporter [Paenibacillus flagellatus]